MVLEGRGTVAVGLGQGHPQLDAVQPTGRVRSGEISAWAMPVPAVIRLSWPGWMGWVWPRLSWWTDLALEEPGHGLEAGVGMGPTAMPGPPATSSGPKWSRKHQAPTVVRPRVGR